MQGVREIVRPCSPRRCSRTLATRCQFVRVLCAACCARWAVVLMKQLHDAAPAQHAWPTIGMCHMAPARFQDAHCCAAEGGGSRMPPPCVCMQADRAAGLLAVGPFAEARSPGVIVVT